MSLDIARLRAQFPALKNNPELVYLDNAATTQKPQAVLDAMFDFYRHHNANVHRGSYQLAARATTAFEAARDQLAEFINANQREEVVFTKGTTDAMNLLANSLGGQVLEPGDRVVIDGWAHHASIVPWQQVAQRQGATLHPIPLTNDGLLDETAFSALLAQNPKVIVLTHVTNALGLKTPLESWLPRIRRSGSITIIDGAQAAAHLPIDVKSLGCDFYCFSGHKMYGPTGIGILWGKKHWLDSIPPYQFGGEMIEHVSFDTTRFNQPPLKFEAGTPAIAEAIGLAAAAKWLVEQDRQAIAEHESELLREAREGLASLGNITIYGHQAENISGLAFNVAQEHHLDVGVWLDQAGIAVRCGHHCCQPLMHSLGVKGTCRVSVAAYNTAGEINAFLDAMSSFLELIYE